MADPLRYVVLHHTGWQDDHFDLMLETSAGALLASWRLSDWPPTAATMIAVNAMHRRAYLDYQGPVSGDRGNVTRVAAGTYEVLHGDPDALRIRLIDQSIELMLPAQR